MRARHVAIIMDGNGRWAEERGLARSAGHRAGAEAVRAVVRAARRMNLPCLTLYAFSEQNWARPVVEIGALMRLLAQFLEEERAELMARGVRLVTIGRTTALPIAVRDALTAVVHDTAANREMTLCLALSYGGRESLVGAVRALVDAVQAGELAADAIEEETISIALDTSILPPVDLIVRTSGEQRLSNFLLWECAYAELLFCDKLWPDFGEDDLADAIERFGRRERRYGALPPRQASSG
jgi:undecaprenyl diphosphate synthase